MLRLEVAALYAGVNILILLVLAVLVVAGRRKHKITLGDGNNEAFGRAVRAHGNEDDQKYLYAMFQSAFVFNQVRGKTTGSSGRRRIDPDMFASLLIPWPDGAVRKKIAAEVSRRRDAARRLREEATRLWDDAKRRFEEELLGPAT